MADAIDAAEACLRAGTSSASYPDVAAEKRLRAVMGSLYRRTRTRPERPAAPCTAAEAAYTLVTFAVTEGVPVHALLGDNHRIRNDRGVSDGLVRLVLAPRAIPHTAGALQSSSLRAGYRSPPSARNRRGAAGEVSGFITWLDTLTAAGREQVFAWMSEQFACHIGTLTAVPPALPPAVLSWPQYVAAVEAVLAVAGGATHQYLVAALLEQLWSSSPVKVRNIQLVAADGTVQVAYEVSAGPWQAKVRQAVEAVLSGRAPRVVVAATVPSSDDTGRQLPAEMARHLPVGVRPDRVDVSVVDVAALCVTLGGQLSAAQRAAALGRCTEMVAEYAPTQYAALYPVTAAVTAN